MSGMALFYFSEKKRCKRGEIKGAEKKSKKKGLLGFCEPIAY
jgi:hypothetical protein